MPRKPKTPRTTSKTRRTATRAKKAQQKRRPKKAQKLKAKAARRHPPLAMRTRGGIICEAGEEKIGFEIHWNEAATATLEQLRDNIKLVAEDVSGTGGVAFLYCRQRATLHQLDWVLISDTELTGLVARAQRQAGESQELASSEGPQRRWDGDGVLE